MKIITRQNLKTISGGNPITINACQEVTASFLMNHYYVNNDMFEFIKAFEAYNTFFTKYCTLEDLGKKVPMDVAWKKLPSYPAD